MRSSALTTSVVLAAMLLSLVTTRSQATLIGLWRFNEGTGTTVADTSGNGLNGVLLRKDELTTYPAWIPGRTGLSGDSALRFGVNGAQNRMEAPYKPVMDSPSGTNAVTMAAWISSEQPNEVVNKSQWGRILQRYQWLMYVDNMADIDELETSLNLGGGSIDVYDLYDPIDPNAPDTTVPISPNSATAPAWTHVCVTYDGSNIRMYVNAQEKYSLSAPGTIKGDWWSWLTVGNEGENPWRDPYVRQFVGGMDDVAYFDTALTPGEITQIMVGDFSGFAPPAPEGQHPYGAAVAALQPTHHYRFGRPGVVAADSGSGQAIDGVLQSDLGGADLDSEGPGASAGLPGFTTSPANRAMGPRNVGAVFLGDGANFASEKMTFSAWVGLPAGPAAEVTWDRVFTNSQEENNLQVVIHEDAEVAAYSGLYLTTDASVLGLSAWFLPKSVVDLVNEQWHHLFVVRDVDTMGNVSMRLVVDGTDLTGQLQTSTETFIVGNEHGDAFIGGISPFPGQHIFSGLIDEVSIWVGEALDVQVGIDLFGVARSGVPFPPGDANHDGVVNHEDAAILAKNWLKDVAGGDSDGDFNNDTRVDDLDASILAANWVYSGGSAAVPEPTFLTLFAGALLVFSLRRRVGR